MFLKKRDVDLGKEPVISLANPGRTSTVLAILLARLFFGDAQSGRPSGSPFGQLAKLIRKPH